MLLWQGLNTSNAVTAFERMEEKVMALEAEADATLQVRTRLSAEISRLQPWLYLWNNCSALKTRTVLYS